MTLFFLPPLGGPECREGPALESIGSQTGRHNQRTFEFQDTTTTFASGGEPGSPDRGLCHHGGQIPSISANPICCHPEKSCPPPRVGLIRMATFTQTTYLEWFGGCRGDALAEMPLVKPRAQLAFKDSMIRGILQFTLRIAFRCVLHRCKSQDIRC